MHFTFQSGDPQVYCHLIFVGLSFACASSMFAGIYKTELFHAELHISMKGQVLAEHGSEHL